MMLGVVIAFVLFGSVVFAAPSSNTTISFVIIVGILLVGKYLGEVATRQPEPLRTIGSSGDWDLDSLDAVAPTSLAGDLVNRFEFTDHPELLVFS